MNRLPQEGFQIGDWQVEPRLNRLGREGRWFKVEPKVMQVLLCLSEKRGQVVTRDELLESVWDVEHVSDHSLSRSIFKLRKALEPDDLIETVPKVGYRLRPAEDTVPQTGKGSFYGPAAAAALFCLALLFLWPDPPQEASIGLIVGQPVTSSPGAEVQGSISPGGDKTAYAARTDEGSWDIFVLSDGNEAPLRLTHSPQPEAAPVWIDDARIAFLRCRTGQCSIVSRPVLGSTETELHSFSPSGPPQLTFSIKRQLLAFPELGAQGRGRLGLFSLSEGPVSLPPLPDSDSTVRHTPAFSPDGSRLAWVGRIAPFREDIFWTNLEKDGAGRVTRDHATILGITWSPDGRELLFSSTRSGTISLWRIGLRGGDPSYLPLAPYVAVRNPWLHPVKGDLLFESWSYDVNVWKRAWSAEGADRRGRRVLASTYWDASPSFSKDGSQIAFVSLRSGHFEIWVSQADGSDARRLTDFQGGFVGSPAFSPDSRLVAFGARQQESGDLYTVDVLTGKVRRWTQDSYENSLPAWSLEGSSIYFVSQRGQQRHICRLDLASGETRDLMRGRKAAPVSESRLLVAEDDGSGWSLVDLAGEKHGTIKPRGGDGVQNWAVADDHLYYASTLDREKTVLVRHDLATGEAVQLSQFQGRVLPASFSVVPSRKQFLYAQMDSSESDLLLVPSLLPPSGDGNILSRNRQRRR